MTSILLYSSRAKATACSNAISLPSAQDLTCSALLRLSRAVCNAFSSLTCSLGGRGALIFSRGRYYYSPGFVVETVDTTGAGDVFHGAFIYGLLAGWEIERILDFSNAMAGLNCTVLGARGGIKSQAEAERLMVSGHRHVNPAYLKGSRGKSA